MSTTTRRLLRLADFLKRPRPCWLIDGLLPTGELAVLFGAYACGKSFVALELAACISQGRPFAGRSVRRGQILYMIGEGSDGMRDRFELLCGEGRIDRDNVIIDDSRRQIGNLDERQALRAELEAESFKTILIVVDTSARHSVGVEENSAKEMGEWIAAIEELAREFGCAVLLVHHEGKNGRKGMRGSSALSGAISTSISCEKHGVLVTLKCDKQKDADEFAPISFRTRKVRHGEVESLVLDHVDASKKDADRLKPDEEAILTALQAAHPRSLMRREFKRLDGSRIPKNTFDRAAGRLIDLGYAQKIGQGEYVLSKSPSPNYPQESPLGIACTPEKSPPSPPPYRGGDVGIRGGVQEVKETKSQKVLPHVSSGNGAREVQVPKFSELDSWPPAVKREEEWLN